MLINSMSDTTKFKVLQSHCFKCRPNKLDFMSGYIFPVGCELRKEHGKTGLWNTLAFQFCQIRAKGRLECAIFLFFLNFFFWGGEMERGLTSGVSFLSQQIVLTCPSTQLTTFLLRHVPPLLTAFLIPPSPRTLFTGHAKDMRHKSQTSVLRM